LAFADGQFAVDEDFIAQAQGIRGSPESQASFDQEAALGENVLPSAFQLGVHHGGRFPLLQTALPFLGQLSLFLRGECLAGADPGEEGVVIRLSG
jgi:hypothetical protein